VNLLSEYELHEVALHAAIERSDFCQSNSVYGLHDFLLLLGLKSEFPVWLERFPRSHKSTHEFTVHHLRDFLRVFIFSKKPLRISRRVYARRFYLDLFESNTSKLGLVFRFFQRTRDASGPQLDAAANVAGHFTARHDV
jgi:hypothetical protein